jgi:hypothetical protein
MIAIMRPLDPLAAVRAGRNQESIARALEQFEGGNTTTPKMRAEEYVYYASPSRWSASATKCRCRRSGPSF